MRVSENVFSYFRRNCKKHEAEDVVGAALQYNDGTKLMVLTTVIPSGDRTMAEELKIC